MTYEEALEYVASLEPRGWRLGLDRMEELLKRCDLESVVGDLGGPQFIHVTGTNGKGSVTAYVQSLLAEQGYRTGAYFSPFVYDPRERIQYGRDLIGKEELANLTGLLRSPAESLASTPFGGATEFEFKTALGFKYWAEKRCDWVALEVGLGGRLDATNVVTPRVSVIVSIGLDHISILGANHEEVAAEKAGIIKPGVPAIVGHVPHAALRVIESVAYRQRAPLWRFGHEISLAETNRGFRVQTPLGAIDGLHPGMRGVKQPHNMALAVAAMQASGALADENAIAAGVEKAFLPGRMEQRRIGSSDVLLDGAHNAEAAEVLRENLELYYPGRRLLLVTGMVSGHDPKRFYGPLFQRVHKAYAVPIAFHRALPVEKVVEALVRLGTEAKGFDSIETGLEAALADMAKDDLLLVAGSFFLVGEVGAVLSRLDLSQSR